MSEATPAGDAPEPTPDVTDLTEFRQRILYILAEEARYGLAVKHELERYYDAEIYHGRLYPNLNDLVTAGFVEKSKLDERTNQYALTDAGVRAVEELLRWELDKYVQGEADAVAAHGLVDDATGGESA